jgi:hypothetical protein
MYNQLITYEALNQDKFFQGTYPPSSMQQQPLVAQGLLIIEASRSHIDTSHSGHLWTSDQPVAETSHNIHNRHKSMLPARFEPVIPATERYQTHWDRLNVHTVSYDQRPTNAL